VGQQTSQDGHVLEHTTTTDQQHSVAMAEAVEGGTHERASYHRKSCMGRRMRRATDQG
jgi:hypothetical protein